MNHIDPVRTARAVSAPGIDPRTWVAKAEVITFVVDTDVGPLADVQVLLPTGETWKDTAKVGAAYAGNGFGLFFPLRPEDEVYVELEAGDPDKGLVITGRVHSATRKPPEEFTSDGGPVLFVEEDVELRIITKGARIHIEARDSDVVVDAGDDVTVNAGGDVTVNADRDVLIDASGNAAVQAGGDATVDATGNAQLSAGGTATVDGSVNKLGAGATAIQGSSRIGDAVQVTIPTGSFVVSAALIAVAVLNPAPVIVTGTITAGSAKTFVE